MTRKDEQVFYLSILCGKREKSLGVFAHLSPCLFLSVSDKFIHGMRSSPQHKKNPPLEIKTIHRYHFTVISAPMVEIVRSYRIHTPEDFFVLRKC